MKKLFKLFTIPSIAIAGLVPTTLLSSCSNKSVSEAVAADAIEIFKELAQIPHSSDKFLKETPYGAGSVWDISCYIKDKVEKYLDKRIFQDKYGNLVFDIPCNDDSLKDAPKIAIQAHMDMVFTYNPDEIPFEPDPMIWKVGLVEEEVDGQKVLHSEKWRTTIGADNGIGVAQILALMQHNEIKHPDIRCILTNCEENGCQGATLLVEDTYPDVLKDYYYVLNIDAEDIGDMYVACSGAVGSYYYINSETEAGGKYVPSDVTNLFKIKIDGFPGGHSGVDIVKRYDNALVFTNELLSILNGTNSSPIVRLNSISTPGSTVYNSLPKTCEVVITCNGWEDKTLDDVAAVVKSAFDDTIEARCKIEKSEDDKRTGFDTQFDPEQYKNVTCTVEVAKPKYKVALTVEDTAEIIKLQSAESLDYGVISWPIDEEVAQLIGEQTSANVGPAEGEMISNLTFNYKLSTYSRSTNTDEIARFFKQNEQEAKEAGATYKYDAKFNPWLVDENQKLFNLCKQGWINAGIKEENTHKSRTHGGLETSLWHQAMETDESKVGKTACISYGPQIYDAHKYTERVVIDSVKQCLDTTIYILAHANELKID